MFHALPDFESSPPQREGSNTKLGDHDTSKSHKPFSYYSLVGGRTHMNRMVME
jgi:hypothetical protein